MPLKKSYARKRKIARKARNTKRMMKSSLFASKGDLALGQKQQHFATLTETILLTDYNVNTTYQNTFTLNQFNRALAVACNYKYYRAKKVIWKYEPLFNFYADDGNDSLPYLYSIMNRTQDNISYSGAQFRAQGVIPQVFNSTKTIAYTPNWCAQGLGAYTQVGGPSQPITSINAQGLRKCYDWLCSPKAFANKPNDTMTPIIDDNLTSQGVVPMAIYTSNVQYNGHDIRFDQVLNQRTSDIARVTCTVVWEFKGPKVDVGVEPN